MKTPDRAGHDVSFNQYQQLAELRFRIRRFLRFSEESAQSYGIEPRQHQLMLVIKGLPPGMSPTVRTISERLCLRHNSTVELVDRLAERGAVVRRPCEKDRREVLVELTQHGEKLLRRLSVLHLEELQTAGPALSEALLSLVHTSELEQHAR